MIKENCVFLSAPCKLTLLMLYLLSLNVMGHSGKSTNLIVYYFEQEAEFEISSSRLQGWKIKLSQ